MALPPSPAVKWNQAASNSSIAKSLVEGFRKQTTAYVLVMPRIWLRAAFLLALKPPSAVSLRLRPQPICEPAPEFGPEELGHKVDLIAIDSAVHRDHFPMSRI